MFTGEEARYLIVDLECDIKAGPARERIYKVAALRADTEQSLERSVNPKTLVAALQAIDKLAEGAQFLLGHNIVDFDLPLLREVAPELSLLKLPVIDTLLLSPLAFPQNPYHRLIKDYKLVRDALNSPLSDCRATHTLFEDQLQAFSSLAKSHTQELAVYHCLMLEGMSVLSDSSAEYAGDVQRHSASMAVKTGASYPVARVADGGSLSQNYTLALDNLFRQFTGQGAASLVQVAGRISGLLEESDPALTRQLKVCRTALDSLALEGIDASMAQPLAYTLAWLRVSGGNSVMAPWVTHQFPQVLALVESLRDTPCGQADCSYCSTTHNPKHELTQYFGFEDFRYESPGQSAQHDVVLASMRGESVLTVLATGGGKSICYQLPALNRFHRNASLTIVISPLQSLMKDQVDGLLALNIRSAAALNGLLTLPERADVLDRIQMGDIGILLVSPEQFRNRGFRRVIQQRRIGAWVFDEAHCLSKWGNDFRPDYLYAARYIKQYTGDSRLAPVCCFTATGKLDVLDDIKEHFSRTLGITFKEFIGTPERPNLHFEVRPVGSGEKSRAIDSLLGNYLGASASASASDGGAVVFVASRAKAEEYSGYLEARGWACAYYHAGLQPNEKKDIQDNFQRGDLRVITATNAFGMGVDKQDVRLVVHADIPGSLENYLQEAGRAGRDQADAWCVLLYDPADIESQFNLSERSRLQQRDIQQILTKLRIEAKRRKDDMLVITAGEILLDEKTQTSFDADDADAQTKVVTAVAWLERGDFLKREENRTTIFPARLTLDLSTALNRLAQAKLPEHRQQSYRGILRYLYKADSDQLINTDTLMHITGMSSEVVSSALRQMEQLGVLQNDTRITVYLRHAVASTSRERLGQSLALEQALFDNLPELAPDLDHGEWVDINLLTLTTWLREATEIETLLPMHVNRLLSSLSQDRDGENKHRSVLELKHLNRDYLKMRLRHNHTWSQLRNLGERRRAVARVILPFLLSKIERGVVGKDVMVDTTFGELNTLLDRDTELCTLIKPDQRERAIQHVLLYLHQQEVLTLNHGMSVMRSAMTIGLNEQMNTGRFVKKHYQKLDEHYRERRIQVHVMREYAERATQDMADALRLVMHYFSDTRAQFNRRYFRGKTDILKLATSEMSWKAIVEDLNEVQRSLVTDETDGNRLILAGPGSGKTRVIVHRVAYLLRVRRIPAEAIIVLTFNRHAANEVRTRLHDLVDRDAWGLTVLTYHAMAMRLTGTSFADRGEAVLESELEAILERAAELLEGKLRVDGEDDIRDQLLQGYRYVLVDEYQDIDERQYRLIRGLTHHADKLDESLSIMAVGDDDQNIYEWRGGSNQHIERFRQEYDASLHYLVENYRSSAAIIDCANKLIANNPQRLKNDHPVRIDQQRANLPVGGDWTERDPLRTGQVLNLELPGNDRSSGNQQAQAVVQELQRLLALETGEEAVPGWNGCAVLARHHKMLYPLRAWCEQNQVDYFLAADKNSAIPLTRQREYCKVVEALRARHTEADYSLNQALIDAGVSNQRWMAFFNEAAEQLDSEFGERPPAPRLLIDWLYEYARSMRARPPGGLYLGTVHASKGLEFRHVVLLDGGWVLSPEMIEQERRLYYVGMTRARETLTLCRHSANRCFVDELDAKLMQRQITLSEDPLLQTRYQTASLKDVDIGYAGSHQPEHRIHAAIAAMQEGDALTLNNLHGRTLLSNTRGEVVGSMAASFKPEFKQQQCSVAGIVVRYRKDAGDDKRFRGRIRCQRWEVIVPAMVG